MANIHDPSEEELTEWREWLASRPQNVRDVAEKLEPWKLYRLNSSGNRVLIMSFGEPVDPAEPVTVRAAVLGLFNRIVFERSVFGILPSELTECDLPAPDEPLGAMFHAICLRPMSR